MRWENNAAISEVVLSAVINDGNQHFNKVFSEQQRAYTLGANWKITRCPVDKNP